MSVILSEPYYRGIAACQAVGISYRQLDYWARTGLVEPSVRIASGSGTQRLYSFRDLVLLTVVKRLLDAGVSLVRIREAISVLAYSRTADLAAITLISDGATTHKCLSPQDVLASLDAGRGIFAIDVGGVFRDVAGTVALDGGAVS